MKWYWLIGFPVVVFFAIGMYEAHERKTAEVQVEEPLMLYYRVPQMRCRQVEHSRMEKTTAFLKEFNLPHVCGQRHGSWVPVGIKECGWRSRVMGDERELRKAVMKLSELGIETSLEEPQEED